MLIHFYIINASIKLVDFFHKQGELVFAQFMKVFKFLLEPKQVGFCCTVAANQTVISEILRRV